MGTCTCTRREFPDSQLPPLESDLAQHEAALNIAQHSVTNLVTGLFEISTNGHISGPRFRLYVQVFKLNFGEAGVKDSTFERFVDAFRKREGYDLKKLAALMVLLGSGEDTLKADAFFWGTGEGQEITKKDLHALLLTLTEVAFTILPQFAIDRLKASNQLSLTNALAKDAATLKSAQERVVAHWTDTLLQGLQATTLSDIRSLFADGNCKALCSPTLLRQSGRSLSALVS